MILELLGTSNLPENLLALATDGRVAVIGVGAGEKGELDLPALIGARARIHGSGMRARPPEEQALVARKVEHEALSLFDAGAAKLLVAETFPLDEAAAYERFEAAGKLGEFVITSNRHPAAATAGNRRPSTL